MLKTIENRILNFVNELAIKRAEIVHGTLYLKLEEDRDCDDVHAMIRTFYRTKIQPDGGVNMYAVGDEFAFDFVPEDRETPVFNDENYSGKEGMMPDDIDKGIWSDFAEEGLMEDLPDDVDTLLELENDMERGK
jgi:hypothetical protein|tara:strand:+ start:224 stop:625 length:402 start_codon:yes stop_codon:yes gene_type:complete